MKTIKLLAKRLFQYEARLILNKYKPNIIAITGSVGKTTTRDFLYNILSKKFFIRKSEKSFTTELGIPLSIIGRPINEIETFSITSFFHFFKLIWHYLLFLLFGLRLLIWKSNYPKWLILEIDGDKPGDIENISQWLYADILVITSIGGVPSHIEEFDSDISKFLLEKKNIINTLKREGVVFYNSDDEFVGRLISDISVRKVSCGLERECNTRSEEFTILSGTLNGILIPIGMSFEIISEDDKSIIKIMDSIGIHNQYASLLSVSVAKELGVSLSESASLIEKASLLPGRMRIISGIKNTTIIDDSYNSSPIAVKQAIEILSRLQISGRKIAVIGDMLELGRYSSLEHKNIAQALRNTASYVVCVGLRARKICDELLSLGFEESKVISFDFSKEAGEFLQDMIQEGDIILVKGSQAMRMERVVEEIMRHPEDKKKLLVRQEEEWLER